MAKMQKSIEIDAPVGEVFTFFSNPENLPEVWPGLVEVSNVQHGTDGPRTFDWTYKMAGIHFRGKSETTEHEENARVVSKNTGGIPSMFVYTYEDVDGRTRLRMEVDYEIPNQLLSKLAEPIVRRLNEHDAEALLHNLKARMEIGREERAAEQPPDQPEERPSA